LATTDEFHIEPVLPEPVADMTMSTAFRINYWLYILDNNGYIENIPEWYRALLVMYRETIPHITEKEDINDLTEKKKIVMEQVGEYNRNSSNFMQARKKGLKVHFQPSGDIFALLDEFDCLIRIKLEKYGLLMKKNKMGTGMLL
jgi:hypothetical protein